MPNCDKGHLPLIANDPTRHWLPIRAKVIDGSWPLGREEGGQPVGWNVVGSNLSVTVSVVLLNHV